MQIQTVLKRIQDAALHAKLDSESNALARLAERVAHQGALFEPPLTAGEMAIVKRFMKL